MTANSHDALNGGIVVVFDVVYVGMFLGGLPRVKIDRAGVASLGAVSVIAITGETVEVAARAVDLPTIVLLFAFMVVSAHMRLGGFTSAVTRAWGQALVAQWTAGGADHGRRRKAPQLMLPIEPFCADELDGPHALHAREDALTQLGQRVLEPED